MNPFSRSTRLSLGLLLAAFVLSACNLGSNAGADPATLAPRASATPPPTLGYTGEGSGVVNPDGAGTPVQNADVELFNMTQQVEVERLMAHVQTLQNFHTRHVNSTQTSETQGIGAARSYIEEQFRLIRQSAPPGVSFTVQLLPFSLNYNGLQTQQYNVLGYLQGSEAGAGVLVVGAHYDSINTDFDDATGFAPGANDNASGVAALIELARVMSQEQPRASVIFVAFSAEEVGRHGSKAFVEWARGRNIDIIGMVNIDSIGNANNRSGQIEETMRIFSCQEEAWCNSPNNASRHMARMVEFLGFAHNATLEMTVEEVADRADRYGDHFSFAEAGYPAVRVINTMEEWGNGSPSDTIEYIEPEYFRKTTQSILLIILALADGPQPPRNISLRDTGTGSSTLVWEPVEGASGYIVALRWAGSQRYDQQIEVSDPNDTNLTWEGFRSYAGISVAARGANGVLGRLSPEYSVQPE